MKTKNFLKIVIILFIFVNTNLNAESVFFDSKNIKIEENGNMIFATSGTATIPSRDLKIEGNKFIYDKLNSELLIFDNVKYLDKENDIIIRSQKMVYDEVKDQIFSHSKTFIVTKPMETSYDTI